MTKGGRSQLLQRLNAIQSLSLPNAVLPLVQSFCGTIRIAEIAAKTVHPFLWQERKHHAIFDVLQTVYDELQGLNKQDPSLYDEVQTILVRS